MRLDDMTHHVGDDCPGGHVAGLRGLKETLITVAPDWTELLTEDERADLHACDPYTGDGQRAEEFARTVAALRALVAEKDEALEFYASKKNWRVDDWGVSSVIGVPEYGKPGRKARAAIALTEEEMRKRLEEKSAASPAELAQG